MRQSQKGKLNEPKPVPDKKRVSRGVRLRSSGGKRAGDRTAGNRKNRPAPEEQDRTEKKSGEKKFSPETIRTFFISVWAAVVGFFTAVRAAAVRFFHSAGTFFRGLKPRLRRLRRRSKETIAEAKTKKFPESNHFFMQLVLVVIGITPMILSRVREKFVSLRGKHVHAAKKEKTHRKTFLSRIPKKYHPVVFGCAALALFGLVFFFSHYAVATVVT